MKYFSIVPLKKNTQHALTSSRSKFNKKSKHQNKFLKTLVSFKFLKKMEEFGVSKQSQDKIPGNSVKRQPSDLDLLFCFECDETFASKSEENRHRCGVDPNVEAIGIDDEDSINVSSSNVEGKKGMNRDIIKN